MSAFRARNGSAVVMTLGILAFTMTAAVAFAVFMRQSRLPSSYLRRVSSTHLMAKAAIAEAVENLDFALADDPGPGLYPMARERASGEGHGGQQQSASRNRWLSRVFLNTTNNVLPAVEDTVNVLSFEGLAYLPPMIVNEVRSASRRTPTAKWDMFKFDAGRYAYVAIDLNGLLDVNRLFANRARSSADCSRISIGHLFEEDNDNDESLQHYAFNSKAEEWDKLLGKSVRNDSEWPQVKYDASHVWFNSLADFNLFVGTQEFGPVQSYFCHYSGDGNTGAGSEGYYGATESFMQKEYVMRNCFTTESVPAVAKKWEEIGDDDRESRYKTIWDLAGEGQPFKSDFLDADNHPLKDVVLATTTAFNLPTGMHSDDIPWMRYLSGLGCAALCDYLDFDRQPISLAIPTCERVPMITGMQLDAPSFEVALDWQRTRDGIKANMGEAQGGSKPVTVTLSYYLDTDRLFSQLQASHLRATFVYPFARPAKDDADYSYNVDGSVLAFFSTKSDQKPGHMGLRTYNEEGNDALHFTGREGKSAPTYDPNNGVMWLAISEQTLKLPTSIDDETDAVRFGNENFRAFPLKDGLRKYMTELTKPLMTLKINFNQTQDASGQWKPSVEEWLEMEEPPGTIVEATTEFKALNADGLLDPRFASGESFKNALTGGKVPELRLNFAAILRIKDTSNSHIVDMVPACYEDDAIQNPSLVQINQQMKRVMRDSISGCRQPLMRFDTGVSFELSRRGMSKLRKTVQPGKINPSIVLCRDPRYNHAPENWCIIPDTSDGTQLDGEFWLKNCGAEDRDGDIFMATSDAGYLQSKYELAFLPRLTDLVDYAHRNGRLQSGNYQAPPDERTKLLTFNERGKELNQELMWRTYDPCGDEQQGFYEMPFVTERRGYRLYPYSAPDDNYWRNVLLSALANTPLDWRHSSTNEFDGGLTYCANREMAKITGQFFNENFAWNGYQKGEGKGGYFCWKDLKLIAEAMHIGFNAYIKAGKGTWEDFYDSLDWSFDENSFLGIPYDTLSKTLDANMLWTTDRKFFYGYWRECFPDHQRRIPPQFFLIFIRAESDALGNMEVKVTSPQLSARAVAIVMRDPNRPKSTDQGQWSTPHRSRVIYYRQFE